MTCELGLEEWLSFFWRCRSSRWGRGNSGRECVRLSQMMCIPQGGGSTGPSCLRRGSAPRARMQANWQALEKSEKSAKERRGLLRGKEQAGRALSSSRRAGVHRWLRAWLHRCSGRFPHPLGCTACVHRSRQPVFAAVSAWKDLLGCVFGQDSVLVACLLYSFLSLWASFLLFLFYFPFLYQWPLQL